MEEGGWGELAFDVLSIVCLPRVYLPCLRRRSSQTQVWHCGYGAAPAVHFGRAVVLPCLRPFCSTCDKSFAGHAMSVLLRILPTLLVCVARLRERWERMSSTAAAISSLRSTCTNCLLGLPPQQTTRRIMSLPTSAPQHHLPPVSRLRYEVSCARVLSKPTWPSSSSRLPFLPCPIATALKIHKAWLPLVQGTVGLRVYNYFFCRTILSCPPSCQRSYKGLALRAI